MGEPRIIARVISEDDLRDDLWTSAQIAVISPASLGWPSGDNGGMGHDLNQAASARTLAFAFSIS